MKAMFDKDIESSRLVTLEKWRERSILRAGANIVGAMDMIAIH